jgi:hypothetical protein
MAARSKGRAADQRRCQVLPGCADVPRDCLPHALPHELRDRGVLGGLDLQGLSEVLSLPPEPQEAALVRRGEVVQPGLQTRRVRLWLTLNPALHNYRRVAGLPV